MAGKSYTFIINTENVNNYGFRILTDGIDTTQYEKNPIVLFMHNRNTWGAKGDEVIGRCVKLYSKNKQLLAEIEFDEEDEFAKKIAGKVEREFIKMASLNIQPIETSEDPKLMLPGQKYETVTKSKLKEISIVDMGGNDDALKLSDGSGNEIQLNELSKYKINQMNKELIAICLALGITENQTQEQALASVKKLQDEKKEAETKLADFETALKTTQSAEAIKLVDKAIEKGVIPAELKDAQVKLFESDFVTQKATFEKLLDAKKEDGGIDTTANQQLADFLGSKKTTTVGSPQMETTFIELSQKNPNELLRLKQEAMQNPTSEDGKKYIQLYEAQYKVKPTFN